MVWKNEMTERDLRPLKSWLIAAKTWSNRNNPLITTMIMESGIDELEVEWVRIFIRLRSRDCPRNELK